MAAAVLAAALLDDPGWISVLPDPKDRAQALATVLAAALRHAGPDASLAVHDDRVVGAAVWQRPGRTPIRGLPALLVLPDLLPLVRLGAQGRALRRFGADVDAAVPRHAWYLQAVGVHPDAQHAGAGSGLLRRGLQRVDRVRGEVYLETSAAGNVPFYERYGFRVISTAAPKGVDTWWRMLRPASSVPT